MCIADNHYQSPLCIIVRHSFSSWSASVSQEVLDYFSKSIVEQLEEEFPGVSEDNLQVPLCVYHFASQLGERVPKGAESEVCESTVLLNS